MIKFIPTVDVEVIFSVFRGKQALMKLSYYFLPGGNTVNCSNRKKGHYYLTNCTGCWYIFPDNLRNYDNQNVFSFLIC